MLIELICATELDLWWCETLKASQDCLISVPFGFVFGICAAFQRQTNIECQLSEVYSFKFYCLWCTLIWMLTRSCAIVHCHANKLPSKWLTPNFRIQWIGLTKRFDIKKDFFNKHPSTEFQSYQYFTILITFSLLRS